MKLTDFKALTFDCYGTLIDWETGLYAALQPLLQKGGITLGRDVGNFGLGMNPVGHDPERIRLARREHERLACPGHARAPLAVVPTRAAVLVAPASCPPASWGGRPASSGAASSAARVAPGTQPTSPSTSRQPPDSRQRSVRARG